MSLASAPDCVQPFRSKMHADLNRQRQARRIEVPTPSVRGKQTMPATKGRAVSVAGMARSYLATSAVVGRCGRRGMLCSVLISPPRSTVQ